MEYKGDTQVAADGGQASTQGPNPVPYPVHNPGPPPPHQAYSAQPPPVYTTTAQPAAGSVPPPGYSTTMAYPAAGSVPPPPPPGYQTAVVIRQGFSTLPCSMTCPNCHNAITTVTHQEVGLMVWMMVGGMILIGLWLGCCLIPFCIDSLKDTVHTCPNCKHTVGKFTHI